MYMKTLTQPFNNDKIQYETNKMLRNLKNILKKLL